MQAVTVGFRFRLRAGPVSAAVFAKLRISGADQIMLRVTSLGSLRISRSGSQDVQSTANSYIGLNTWYTAMWRTKIANSPNGEWEVRILPDGGVVDTPLSGTGADTQSSATLSTANELLLGDQSDSLDPYFDEGWIDLAGGLPGICRVETLAITGAGGLTQLTRGGADSGANWSQVEEWPANGDTDYVVSTGSDQFDSYAFANRSVVGTPLAVQVNVEGKFASAGTRRIILGLRINGVVYEGAMTHTLTSAYSVYREVFNNNPETGDSWDDSEIDGAELVIRCLDTDCRITNGAIEVIVQI